MRCQQVWTRKETWDMEDYYKAGKSWQQTLRYFPGRSPYSVEAKWYSVMRMVASAAERREEGIPLERGEPATEPKGTSIEQDDTVLAALGRAHAERRRLESVRVPQERKRA